VDDHEGAGGSPPAASHAEAPAAGAPAEGVRIVGAQPAAELVADEVARCDAAQPATMAEAPTMAEADGAPDAGDEAAGPGSAGAAAAVGGAPVGGAPVGNEEATGDAALAVPDLPPWTDPPTGQIPAVLERSDREEVDDPWTAAVGGGPSWREHDHEWDDPTYEPAMLAEDPSVSGSLSGAGEDDDWLSPTWGPDDAAGVDEDAPEAPGEGAGTSGLAGTVPAGAGGRRGRRHRSTRPPGRPQPARSGDEPGSDPSAGRRGGRNVPVAIATGLVVAAVAVGCFSAGAVPSEVLAVVIVTAAAAEGFGTLRRAGYRPATLVGLAATVGSLVAAYNHGLGALAVVAALTVLVTMAWYLLGLSGGSAVEGIGVTLLLYGWVGLLGSFAAVLVAPSLFPHRHGVAFLFGAVAAVVAADVGALAVGAWRGRHPLAPRISPNKTWEGAIGGAVAAVVVSTLVTGHMHPWTPGKAAILGVVAAVLAPVGDLAESLVKRELGLKDMGSVLPGHGGVLDRFDGMLFVLPATFFLVRLLRLG